MPFGFFEKFGERQKISPPQNTILLYSLWWALCEPEMTHGTMALLLLWWNWWIQATIMMHHHSLLTLVGSVWINASKGPVLNNEHLILNHGWEHLFCLLIQNIFHGYTDITMVSQNTDLIRLLMSWWVAKMCDYVTQCSKQADLMSDDRSSIAQWIILTHTTLNNERSCSI